MAAWQITSFYKFTPLANLASVKSQLRDKMEASGILGLIVLAQEGINGTVASQEDLADFKITLTEIAGELRFKDSQADLKPFHRVSIDLRSEIVGMKQPELAPKVEEDHHLSAAQWHAMLQSSPVVIDTRNSYETKAGKFKNAIDPELGHFSEWPQYLDKADLPKDEPILIYCTGGIRCEKAILAMRERGFEQVFQLRDGILGYLAEFPYAEYEGECFVFDNRVTVGQDLKPTGNYGICPGCGLTSSEKRPCANCGNDYFVCSECEPTWTICSKTCRSQVEARSRRK